ncbi:uncharacterized protein E0L32_000438 [Thyridium curvatum]|uniref:FAD-binding PCMH-type domain-containing protein n=1 Tax=Thyridium curvatum TaxID=1093900 RepID=A0A507B5Q2_9PEZI|nr:uncharacterized protein E0L32_000438 [Thyridium curvatum]TPX14044.1 hypothetical protein E0L32_000438 [Thyridium curvatum]
MSPRSLLATAAIAATAVLPHLAYSQTIQDKGQTVPATNATVAPAVQAVDPASTDLEADYFNFEAAQLTPDVISNLTNLDLTNITLFDFANSTVAARSLGARSGWCKQLPGDFFWPGDWIWGLLDLLTGGALIEGTPSAAVCYQDWPQYDAAKCQQVTAKWTTAPYHEPTGLDWPLYEGVSCLPPSLTREGAKCTQGAYPSYVLKVTNVAQIQLALNFARNLNLRLIVKNKGHDFNGKSSGAGSLSIWTNSLNDIRYLPSYKSKFYTGPALKIGSGVAAQDVFSFADSKGLDVVGGIARTVGLGGGYIAGGGHSPLMGVYGMAADQVLAMEVVLPDGRYVSADSERNSDLFWALRGGGGSTFGVVTSLVIRAYPKKPVTILTYSFGSSATISKDLFWKGVRAVFDTFPQIADAGHYRYYTLMCQAECSFSMGPHWANNAKTADVKAINDALFANLTAMGINITNAAYKEYDGARAAFEGTFPASTEVVGSWNYHTGSRLFPRSNWEDQTKATAQFAAIQKAVEDAGMVIGYNFRPAVNSGVDQNNAVTPAWRNTLAHVMLGALWGPNATPQDIADASKTLTARLQTWRDVSPGAGAYMNEADANEPDFQQSFYGSNYQRLYALKQQYDPWGLFYAPTAVGSEDWYVSDQIDFYPTQNGRLCKK